MIDLLFVIVVEFVLDCEPVWFVKPGDHVQDVPLVLDAIPVKRGMSHDEIVDELIGRALNIPRL